MATTQLQKTPTNTNSRQTFTFSFWLKRSKVSSEQCVWTTRASGSANVLFRFNADATFTFKDAAGDLNLISNRLFRDTSSWYNIILAVDTTQGTAANRAKIYVNGVQETSFSTATYPNQNTSLEINEAGNQECIIGSENNQNYFTLAGGTLTNTEDCPSNVFATINPLNYQLSGCTLANGNTSLTATGGNGWRTFYGTLAGSSGKFYWEQKVNSYSGSSHYIGISDIDESRNVNTNDFENGGVSAYCYRADGGKVTSVSGSTVLTAGVGASFGAGDIIGIAMDLDNQKIYFSKNGTWQNSGDPTSGATGTGSFFDITAGKLYTPATATYNTSNQFFSYNFGNGTFGTTDVSSAGTAGSTPGVFEYDVPTGYEPMTTKGLNS